MINSCCRVKQTLQLASTFPSPVRYAQTINNLVPWSERRYASLSFLTWLTQRARLIAIRKCLSAPSLLPLVNALFLLNTKPLFFFSLLRRNFYPRAKSRYTAAAHQLIRDQLTAKAKITLPLFSRCVLRPVGKKKKKNRGRRKYAFYALGFYLQRSLKPPLPPPLMKCQVAK